MSTTARINTNRMEFRMSSLLVAGADMIVIPFWFYGRIKMIPVFLKYHEPRVFKVIHLFPSDGYQVFQFDCHVFVYLKSHRQYIIFLSGHAETFLLVSNTLNGFEPFADNLHTRINDQLNSVSRTVFIY